MGGASAGEEAAVAIGSKHAEAVTAFNRFGFGARPGDLDAAAGDPRGLLLEELWTADVALIRDRVPPSGLMAFEAYYLDQQKQRAARMKIAMAASPRRRRHGGRGAGRDDSHGRAAAWRSNSAYQDRGPVRRADGARLCNDARPDGGSKLPVHGAP